MTKIILGLIILLSNIKPPTNHQEEAMTTAQLFLQKFLHNGFFAMECLLALGLLALSLRCIPWYFSQRRKYAPNLEGIPTEQATKLLDQARVEVSKPLILGTGLMFLFILFCRDLYLVVSTN
ncbi:MAG: hypothetical protein RB292_04520 [Patescibacteria group bacterium]|nr:hypothetical protein [Patescibacteria group bacterium]